MGYERHNAIVVSTFTTEYAITAHKKALEVFKASTVSNIINTYVNGVLTFLIGPDGSKEGWEASERGDARREQYVAWLSAQDMYSWVEVQYGDENKVTKVCHHSSEEELE